MGGHVDVCWKLLEAKASANLAEVNHRGNTALHFACVSVRAVRVRVCVHDARVHPRCAGVVVPWGNAGM